MLWLFVTVHRKLDVIGTVSVVIKNFLKISQVTNGMAALRGTAPKLVVTYTHRQPGQRGVTLNIRGLSLLKWH